MKKIFAGLMAIVMMISAVMCLDFSAIAVENVELINIITTGFGYGNSVGDATITTDNENVEIALAYWQYNENGFKSYNDEESFLQKSTRIDVALNAKDGYKITSNTKIQINGKDVTTKPTCPYGKYDARILNTSEFGTPQAPAHTHKSTGAVTYSNANRHYKRCDVCGADVSAAHSFDNGVVTTPATEEAEGVKTYSCTVCSYEKTEPIPMLNPSIKSVSLAVNGYKYGLKVSEATISTEVKGIQIDRVKYQNQFEDGNFIDYSQNATFLNRVNKLSITISAKEDYSFAENVEVIVNGKSCGTVASNGSTIAFESTELFDSSNANDHLCVQSQTVSYASVDKHYYRCSLCGKTMYEGEHSYENVVYKAPTCIADGKSYDQCTVCKKAKDNSTKTVEKLGHNIEIIEAVNPTCFNTGLTAGERCIRDGCDYEVKQESVDMLEHKLSQSSTPATLTKNGSIFEECSTFGCTYKKQVATISYPKSITLSATSFVYDGKVKKPAVKVVGADGKTINASNYKITGTTSAKAIGTYTITITFKGNYSGTKKLTYKINPKGTTISKLTATKGGFKAVWKKQASQTTGYQIQFSTSSKFTSATTKTVAKNSTTSATYSKLSKGKKYYVRIRTYTSVKGTKYYSSWSGARAVTTKK